MTEFSSKVFVSGEVTEGQLRRLTQLSRLDGGKRLSSFDIACIRSVVEALKVRR